MGHCHFNCDCHFNIILWTNSHIITKITMDFILLLLFVIVVIIYIDKKLGCTTNKLKLRIHVAKSLKGKCSTPQL